LKLGHNPSPERTDAIDQREFKRPLNRNNVKHVRTYLFRPFKFRTAAKNAASTAALLETNIMYPACAPEPPGAPALKVAEKKEPMREGLSAVNRRKEERILTNQSIYVVVDTTPQMLGQLVEISVSGLAFTFVDLENASERLINRTESNLLNLDLFAGGKGYYVRNLPCCLKSRIEKPPVSTHASPQIIRVGVEFEHLSLQQQIQINALIRRYGTRDL
jgi:hypothetical protein